MGADPRGWYHWRRPTAEEYKAAAFDAQKRSQGVGFLSNIIENHDEPRGVTHYLPEGERSDEAKTMLGGLNFMLRGLPFLYQGQEIGMENVTDWPIENYNDINTLDEYQVALRAGLTPEEALAAVARFSRDNARTPFQWDASPNAGFTTGTPWLPVNSNYTRLNLAEQRGRAGSVYEFYRQLIALRKNPRYAQTVVYGDTLPYRREQKNLMAYFRQADKRLLVAGNFQKEAQEMPLPGDVAAVLLNNLDTLTQRDGRLILQGWQFLVLEMA